MTDSFELICLPGMDSPREIGAGLQSRSLENPSVSIADPDAIAEAFGWAMPTDSGQSVNPGKALSLSTFWAAVKMISGDVSRLPMATFRRRPNGLRPLADDSHQLWPFLQPLGMANDELSTLKLWRRAMVHALVYENAYVWLDWSPSGRLLGMHNLLSDRTVVARHKGELWCVTEVGGSTGNPRMVARRYDEIIHIEGLCIDGLAGCDLVYQAREDIGVALASRQFKSKFFAEGMHAGGVLQVPPGAKPDNVRKMEDAIKEHHSSSNKAFRTLVMRDGFKWFNTQVNPQQAEMTQMDETEIRNLCRRFMLQPGRMGLRDSVSYNSLEAEKRDYYDTTLSYWASLIRSEVNCKALTEAERREWLVDYNVSLALLWADASTLITVATQGINARDHKGRSIFDADEVRAWFQLPEREDDILTAPPEGQSTEEAAGASDGEADAENAPKDDGQSEVEPQATDEMRAAHRELLASELRRLVRRLNVGTAKAAKRGQVDAWAGSLLDDTLAVACESLWPVVVACRSTRTVDNALTVSGAAGAIACDLLGRYSEQVRAAELRDGWDDKDWQVAIADAVAADWIK